MGAYGIDDQFVAVEEVVGNFDGFLQDAPSIVPQIEDERWRPWDCSFISAWANSAWVVSENLLIRI
jgi:hypothetical protein